MIFSIYTKFISLLLIPVFYLEHNFFYHPKINERPIEFSFLFEWLWRLCPTDVLDVGSGSTALPHILTNCGFNVIALDEKGSYWNFDYFNRHFPILKDDILNPKINRKFDLINWAL